MSPIRGDGLVVVCTYRVRKEMRTEFEALLARHAPTLKALGLIVDKPVRTLRHHDEQNPVYVEVLEWSSIDAADRAAEVPEVIAIWEPMAAACEPRDGRPGLEFPLFDEIGSMA